MKYKILPLLIMFAVSICGCSRAPEKPKLSEIFKSQLIQYLKDAGKISSQSADGISFMSLSSDLAEAKATFDLLEQTWPDDLWVDARKSFKKAHEGYALTLKLWNGKLEKYDNPTEPDINNWKAITAYAGSELIIEIRSPDYLVENYRGKRFLPFDENISVLLGLAGAEFKKGRSLV